MSFLIERFVAAKDTLKPDVAEHEVVKCVSALRRRVGLRAVAPSNLEPFLASRNITSVAIEDDLKADGALVPLGRDFGAGFRMVLRRDLPEGRINFTVAHEICHTFFYERVPEVKFAAHAVDQEEERRRLFPFFCYAAIFLFFTLSGSRRTYYLMPVAPFVSVALAQALIEDLPRWAVRFERVMFWAFAVAMTIAGAAALFAGCLRLFMNAPPQFLNMNGRITPEIWRAVPPWLVPVCTLILEIPSPPASPAL